MWLSLQPWFARSSGDATCISFAKNPFMFNKKFSLKLFGLLKKVANDLLQTISED
jgi:hypothetical protein